MPNLFDCIPSNFFNYLSSGSNSRVYSECLRIIYHQYEQEISYRLPRKQIRDALAEYLLRYHVELEPEEGDIPEDTDLYKNNLANGIIRRFCLPEVGWLEEETDDATYEKHILMTDRGVQLAEFLETLIEPHRVEYTTYISNIYFKLKNPVQWEKDPYVFALKDIYNNARQLSSALKQLSTSIRTIIEDMVQEQTLESLTENLISYCEGDFIREYARLTRQQNIHVFRRAIVQELQQFEEDEERFTKLVEGAVREGDAPDAEAESFVLDRLLVIRRFFDVEYDRIMSDIKRKLNIYLHLAVGRARFLRNREADIRGNVERTLQYLVEETSELNGQAFLPDEYSGLFAVDRNEFLDELSVKYPGTPRQIRVPQAEPLEAGSEEDLKAALELQRRELDNPYSAEKIRCYVDALIGSGDTLSSRNMPLSDKGELLASLSAVAYAGDNGFRVEPGDGYFETEHMILREFTLIRSEDK